MSPGLDLLAAALPPANQPQHVEPLVLGLMRQLVATEQQLARAELLYRQREAEHAEEAAQLRARIAELTPALSVQLDATPGTAAP